MHKKMILGLVVLVALGLAATHAKEAAQGSSDEQAIRKSIGDYCAAFNDGKLEAVLAFWTNDADYINQDGKTYRGKDAVGALFKDAIEKLKGYKLDLKVENIRVVKPDVAIEDGVAVLSGPDGEKSNDHYTATWIKDGDRWLITSARDLPESEKPAAPANADNLKPLEWLVGEWQSEDKGPAVSISSKWALDKNYLVQDYTVAGEAGDDLHVMQLIGFDPVSGQLKSWAFDSRGGYGEGLWDRDENSWSSESRGVLPDGRIGSAVNSVRFVDDAHMEWHSTGRNIEGQPMPDTQVKFVRKGEAAKDGKQ